MKNPIKLAVQILGCIALTALFTFNTITFIDNSHESELSLASLKTAFAQNESGGTGTGYEAIIEGITNYSKTTVGKYGVACVETGTVKGVNCIGSGSLNCTPSSTQISGPWYSGGCL